MGRPLTQKQGHLLQSLRRAAKAAEESLTPELDDGLACNLDSVRLALKGWRQDTVKKLCGKVGVGAFKTTQWGIPVFVLCFPHSGQGMRRTVPHQAAAKSLKESGYDASVWWQAD